MTWVQRSSKWKDQLLILLDCLHCLLHWCCFFFLLCLFDQLEINCEAGSISGCKGNGSGSSTGGPRRPKGDKGGNAAGEGDKESLI